MLIEIPGLKEAWQRLRLKEQWEEKVITKASGEVADSLRMTKEEAQNLLSKIRMDYLYRTLSSEGIEKASEAKASLLNLAEKAEALEAAVNALGQGAVEVMNRRSVRQDLIKDAEPEGLPDRNPHGPGVLVGATPDEQAEWEKEYYSGGRWAIRLRALAELARVKAGRIEEQVKAGGRVSFAARLAGKSDEDWLAEACHAASMARGCSSQAVVVKMVRAILEADKGPFRIGKNIGLHAGRKAVRKLMAQTGPESGTV